MASKKNSVLGNDPLSNRLNENHPDKPKKKAEEKPAKTVQKRKAASSPKASKKTATKQTKSSKAPKKTAKKSTTAKKKTASSKTKTTAAKMSKTAKKSDTSKKTATKKTAKAAASSKKTVAKKRPVAKKKTTPLKPDVEVLAAEGGTTHTANSKVGSVQLPVKYAENPHAFVGNPAYYDKLRLEETTPGEELGFDPKFREKLDPIVSFLYKYWWRVQVRGVSNIPENGRVLLVGNHSGILPYDGLMVMSAVHREHAASRNVWPMVEDFFYYPPILGVSLNKLGFIRACQENAQRLLLQDEAVLVFPEGIKGINKPYSMRYQLQRFGRGGYIKLSLTTDAPVIPVAVIGSEETHPIVGNVRGIARLFKLPYFPVTPTFPWLGPAGLVPFPVKWTIRFGEPIYVNRFGPEAADDRVAIGRLSKQVRDSIQRMLNEERARRASD